MYFSQARKAFVLLTNNPTSVVKSNDGFARLQILKVKQILCLFVFVVIVVVVWLLFVIIVVSVFFLVFCL